MPISKQLCAGVVFVGQIPRTNIGQIDRHYFKELVKYGIINRYLSYSINSLYIFIIVSNVLLANLIEYLFCGSIQNILYYIF